MERLFLHEEISVYKTFTAPIEIPEIISKGLSPKIVLREYQEEAARNFIINFNKSKNKQIHNLFHMATGSGKTVIMTGFILYLYIKGYRKFLFFVNQTNVLEKTIENFTNPLSNKYLFKEAQLIDRGARYCPFVIDDEEYKFKRKYDGDIANKNRILEMMYFHSKNDSKYISELKQALVGTGLQAPNPITLEYKLKDEFKDSDFYRKSFVYSNRRLPKSRDEINAIEPSMQTKTYHYVVLSGSGNIINLIEDNDMPSLLSK